MPGLKKIVGMRPSLQLQKKTESKAGASCNLGVDPETPFRSRRNYGVAIRPEALTARRERIVDHFYIVLFGVLLSITIIGWLGLIAFVLWYMLLS